MGSSYIEGPNGLHFNWRKEPSFECPNADPVSYTPPDTDGEDGTWTLTRDEVAAAAAAIDADPVMLGRLLKARHTSSYAGRLRVDGCLTDRCAVCGAKMSRKGFRAWIDGPPTEGSGKRIAERLGFGAVRTPIRTTWHKTKKEAEAWARHECKRAKAAP